MQIVKDILGKEVLVNNWIAVSMSQGKDATLRIGKVIGFGRRNMYGQEIDTMAVEWYLSSGRVPDKPTSIDSGKAKFIVIDSPL